MPADEVKIVIKAEDQASATVQKLSGSLLSLGNLVKVGAVAGFAALTAEAFRAVGAFDEAEAASKQLEHAVLQVSHGTREQLEATNELADALERKGVLDGDNIKTGLAQLSTFGLSNKAVQALGGSLADLAVNQFGVNASGEQLSDTANMIAKALNGQFGVLEKSGIRFTELQQHMIMTGTEMEKVKAINEGFAQNLKYTNDVAMQTGEGLKAHLGVQLGNIEEKFGELLSKAVNPMITAFSQWLDKIWPTIDALMNMQVNIEPLKTALVNMFNAIMSQQIVIDFFKALKEAWDMLVLTWQTKVQPSLQQLWEAMKPLAPILELLAKLFGAVLIVALTLFVKLVTQVIAICGDVIKIFTDVATFILKTEVAAWNAMNDAIQAVINGFKTVIEWGQKAKNAVGNFANNVGSGISNGVSSLGSSIAGGAKSLGIPGFADGGIVPGAIGAPMLAVVHGGERVIPNGGSGGVQVNITGTFMSQDAAMSMADLMIKQLQKELRI